MSQRKNIAILAFLAISTVCIASYNDRQKKMGGFNQVPESYDHFNGYYARVREVAGDILNRVERLLKNPSNLTQSQIQELELIKRNVTEGVRAIFEENVDQGFFAKASDYSHRLTALESHIGKTN